MAYWIGGLRSGTCPSTDCLPRNAQVNPLDSYPTDSLPNTYKPTLRAGNAGGYPLDSRPTDFMAQVGRVVLSVLN
jgi:hypothetical protein